MNPLRTIGSLFSNVSNMIPASTVTYTGSPAPQALHIPNVPDQYAPDVQSAVSHTGMATSTLVGDINAENGGRWVPTLRGVNPSDVGITQLNTGPKGAIAAMTKTNPGTGTNFFQQTWGHPFNIANGSDQIKLQANYLNYLRQYLLPGQGIKNPTDQQVLAAYNNAKNPVQQRSYLNLVNSRIANPPATTTQ